MTIDTKRLATDAAYWDEVAPEGAIYFDTESELFFNDQGYWPVLGPFKVSYSQNRCSSRFISRPGHEGNSPQAPAAPEWDGEGLPPIGTVCEKAPHWYKCEIIAEHDGGLVVYDMHSLDYYKVGLGMNFRPLRTKEERQREELIDLISHHPIYKNAVNTLADDIIAAGWTKP